MKSYLNDYGVTEYEITTFSVKEDLERFIDKFDVQTVLDFLTDICNEKAEHIRTNWQDEQTAMIWEEAAAQINCASDEINI